MGPIVPLAIRHPRTQNGARQLVESGRRTAPAASPFFMAISQDTQARHFCFAESRRPPSLCRAQAWDIQAAWRWGDAVKQCSNCGAQAGNDARHCPRCTSPFPSNRPAIRENGVAPNPESSGPVGNVTSDSGGGWLILGAAFVCIGLTVIFYGLTASGAPEGSDTLNIGLLNDKTNAVLAGGFCFTSGAIFLAGGAILKKLSQSIKSKTPR